MDLHLPTGPLKTRCWSRQLWFSKAKCKASKFNKNCTPDESIKVILKWNKANNDILTKYKLILKVNLYGRKVGRKCFYLTTHSKHFIYSYMASDTWQGITWIAREETRCRHIGYSFRLAARVLLYAPSHRLYSAYHGFCYTSHGALAGT